MNATPKAQPQNHPMGVRLAAFQKGQIWQAPGHLLMNGKARAIHCEGVIRNKITRESAVRFYDAKQGYFDIGLGEMLEQLTLVIQP